MAKLRENAASAAKVCAALVGTVVGAGFVSGAELVRFFPSQGFLPWVLFSAVLFFAAFFSLMRLGEKYGGYAGALRSVFGRFAPPVRALTLACSFILCGGMFAGLDAALRAGFGLSYSFPWLALLAGAALFLFSGRGMGAVCAVNLLLVPLILFFLARFAVGAEFSGFPYSPPTGFLHRALSAALYTFLNAFLSAPVACDLGARFPSRGRSVGCAAASAAVGFCAAVVLGCVARGGAGAYTAEMPLLYALGGGGKVFSLVCLCGIFTTLVSSYYPLHAFAAERRHPAALRIGFLLSAFLLSLLGLRGIVDKIYPLLGGLGALFFAACAFSGLRSRLGKMQILAVRRKQRAARKGKGRPEAGMRQRGRFSPNGTGCTPSRRSGVAPPLCASPRER